MEKRKIFDRFAKIDFTKENLNYFYHILVLTYLYNLSDQSSRSPALPCLNPKTWTVQGLGGLDLFSRNIFALKDKTIGEDREHVGTTFHVIFRSFSSRNFFSHHSQRTCWTSSHVILLAPVSKTLWPVQTSFSRNFQLPPFSREFIRCLLVWRIFFGLLGSQKSTSSNNSTKFRREEASKFLCNTSASYFILKQLAHWNLGFEASLGPWPT